MLASFLELFISGSGGSADFAFWDVLSVKPTHNFMNGSGKYAADSQ
jgi:hypothetical protein